MFGTKKSKGREQRLQRVSWNLIKNLSCIKQESLDVSTSLGVRPRHRNPSRRPQDPVTPGRERLQTSEEEGTRRPKSVMVTSRTQSVQKEILSRTVPKVHPSNKIPPTLSLGPFLLSVRFTRNTRPMGTSVNPEVGRPLSDYLPYETDVLRALSFQK